MIVDEVSSHREASPADWQTQFPDYIDVVTIPHAFTFATYNVAIIVWYPIS